MSFYPQQESRLRAEYYAMQPSSPSAAEQHAETPLLTPDEFRVLVARVRRNTSHFIALAHMTVYSFFISFVVIQLRIIFGGPITLIWCSFLIVGALMLITSLFTAYARQDIKVEQQLARYILKTCDPIMLGPILELKDADEHPGHVYSSLILSVNEAVVRLLPLMQTANVDALNTRQRERMRSFLFPMNSTEIKTPAYTPERAFSILRLLEQVGDKRDLPDVERFLENGSLLNEPRVVAERCAQVIQERIAKKEGKDVLLRPERKPEAVESLLRSSEERQDTSAGELLRATSADNADMPA